MILPFPESLHLVRADSERIFELASEWFAERKVSDTGSQPLYRQDISILYPYPIRVSPFGGKQEWYRGTLMAFRLLCFQKNRR